MLQSIEPSMSKRQQSNIIQNTMPYNENVAVGKSRVSSKSLLSWYKRAIKETNEKHQLNDKQRLPIMKINDKHSKQTKRFFENVRP